MNHTYDPNYIADGYSKIPDRKTINSLSRFFYSTHPIVNSIITTHTEVPLNYFHIKMPADTTAASLFNKQIQDLHLMNKLSYIIQEYWLFGECFVYAELNSSSGLWADLKIQNPDYVIVKKTVTGDDLYFLRPDENLRRMVLSKKAEDIDNVKLLSKEVIKYIKKGENIPLDNFYLSHFVRRTSPYEARGTSILLPILKLLATDVEQDPITKKMIRECLMDPLLNSSITKGKLRSSYNSLFTGLEQWLKRKIFTPIAKINNLYDDDKNLIIPEISFDLNGLMKALYEEEEI